MLHLPGRFLSHSRQQYHHQHQRGLRHLEIVRMSFQSLGQNTGDKQFRKRKDLGGPKFHRFQSVFS